MISVYSRYYNNVSVYLYWSGESRKIRICPNPTVACSGGIVLPGVYVTCILTVLIFRDKTLQILFLVLFCNLLVNFNLNLNLPISLLFAAWKI